MREKDIEIQEQELLRAQLLNLMDFSVPEESLQNKKAIEKQKEQDNKNTDSPHLLSLTASFVSSYWLFCRLTRLA